MNHEPVLLKEVIKVLDPKPGEFFIDGTLDGGGHGLEILKRISPGGTFLGVDWDSEMTEKFNLKINSAIRQPAEQKKIESKVILENGNFKDMAKIIKNKKLGRADGILLDLGFSSEQLENSGRGFSFLKDEPLLMNYSKNSKPAFEWLKKLSSLELEKIIREFGEERFASRIAKAIKKNLPILRTAKLAEVVRDSVPRGYERGRINPATRTFQALRIFVNQELENLKEVILDLPNILNPGGRVAIISFHSLEDGIVKRSFKYLEKNNQLEIFNKKPISSSYEEISKNRRARSAKLRSARII